MKAVDREQIGELCAGYRRDGKHIVFTNGCFDIIHPGHIYNLYSARREGDILVVGLNSDDSVRRLKGPRRPIFSAEERAELLMSFFFVDHVSIFDEDTPLELVLRVRPHVLVKGGDYAPENIVGRAEVEGWGGRLVIIPEIPGFSSSDIIGRVEGDRPPGGTQPPAF
ncbi:MAG TPA: adenylyltransferase/cytidyltransferase family protein [bacterium]|nr:MAG: Bifunctional protein HldE [bacterium ADurb.Bin236]HPI76512.1 adenylyltransferase/cytidyltransferase family protein [bacterium]HPN94095.1 adenylyltransferase/cytidyltransferase family protein [bacterium]